jgi:hypothetical protein
LHLDLALLLVTADLSTYQHMLLKRQFHLDLALLLVTAELSTYRQVLNSAVI